MGNKRKTCVYVGNLSDDVKKADLKKEFRKYGFLESIWVACKPPGFGFIVFRRPEDAQKACDSCNDRYLVGRNKLVVEIAKSNRRRRDYTSRGVDRNRNSTSGYQRRVAHSRAKNRRDSYGSARRGRRDYRESSGAYRSTCDDSRHVQYNEGPQCSASAGRSVSFNDIWGIPKAADEHKTADTDASNGGDNALQISNTA